MPGTPPAPPLSLGRVTVPAPPAARPGSHVLALLRALLPRENGPSVPRLPPRRGPDGQTDADRPEGPFAPISGGPVTPPEWECLDGTLYLSGEGRPYLVFCHEWLQVENGEMCALPRAGVRPDRQTQTGRRPLSAQLAPHLSPPPLPAQHERPRYLHDELRLR